VSSNYDWGSYYCVEQKSPAKEFLQYIQSQTDALIQDNKNFAVSDLKKETIILEEIKKLTKGTHQIPQNPREQFAQKKILDEDEGDKKSAFYSEIIKIIKLLNETVLDLKSNIIYEPKDGPTTKDEHGTEIFNSHFLALFSIDFILLFRNFLQQQVASEMVEKINTIISYIDELMKRNELTPYLERLKKLQVICCKLHEDSQKSDLYANEIRIQKIKKIYLNHIKVDLTKTKLTEEEILNLSDLTQFGINNHAQTIAADICKLQNNVINLIKTNYINADRLHSDSFLVFSNEMVQWLKTISRIDNSKPSNDFITMLQNRINYLNSILSSSGANDSIFPIYFGRVAKLTLDELKKIHTKSRHDLPEVTDLSNQLIQQLKLLLEKSYQYVAYLYLPGKFSGKQISLNAIKRGDDDLQELLKTEYGDRLLDWAKGLDSRFYVE
jgi:hypothetical protein